MAMSSKRLLIAAIAGAALTGCNTANSHIGDEDPFFGESVKYNAAVQTINPEPVYAEGGAQPGDNGERGARAVERYRTDKINARHSSEAEKLTTTRSVGGGPR
jgi:type IV pilus biogenesis protein CpaD/CtpE